MINRSLRLLGVLTVCLLANQSVTAAEFSSYRAEYNIEKYESEIARSSYHLRVADDHLHFSQHSELTGFASFFRDDTVDESSDIDLSDQHWRLRHYSYHQAGDSKPRDLQFGVDWTRRTATNPAATITGRYVDTDFQLETSHEIWDPLSVLLALARDYQDGRDDYHYMVVTRGSLKPYQFELKGEDTIDTEYDSYATVQFVRQHGKRTTKIWLSTEHNFIPVRIEQHKDGKLNTSMSIDTMTIHHD